MSTESRARSTDQVMTATDDWAVSKNQRSYSRLAPSLEGDAMIYRALRHFWHPVSFSDDIEDAPRSFRLCDEPLVVVRMNGGVRVFNDLCPHRGSALSLGQVIDGVSGQELRCAHHGWQYDADGACVRVPQRPDLAGHLRARVRQYHSCEAYGLVWICLANEPRFPIPEFPEWEDDAYDKISFPSDEWACSAPRRTENYTDLGHFAIVHDGILGDSSHPEAPEHEVWREPPALRMRTVHAKLEPWQTKYDEEPPESIDGLVKTSQNWWLHMPLTVRFHQEAPGDRHYVLFFHPTPLGPRTTRNFTLAATRNLAGKQGPDHEPTIEFMKMIYEQDRPIVESQRPEELAEDLSEEIHLRGVDTFSVQYRRWLFELAQELDAADAVATTSGVAPPS